MKIEITMELEKENANYRDIWDISRSILTAIYNKNIVPWQFGFDGKTTVTVTHEEDTATCWCTLEEFRSQAEEEE